VASLLRKSRYSPLATCAAWLQAFPNPAFVSLRSTLTPRSRSRRSAVPSVDALSTTISSKATSAWASRASRQAYVWPTWLKVTTTIEISGRSACGNASTHEGSARSTRVKASDERSATGGATGAAGSASSGASGAEAGVVSTTAGATAAPRVGSGGEGSGATTGVGRPRSRWSRSLRKRTGAVSFQDVDRISDSWAAM